jgi:hypothetical protein
MDQPVSRPSPVAFPDNLSDSETKALQAIDRFIANSPDNSRIFWINPVQAQYLLDRYNDGNRAIKPKKINEYKDAMQEQRWRLTGDTLKFSDKGLLRDGQNRLMACAAGGAPFQTHIVFGIPHEFFNAMDQGKNRGGSDMLHIAGVTAYTAIIAAGVRWAQLYENDTVRLRTTLQPPEVLRLFQERFTGIEKFAPIAGSIYGATGWPAGFLCGTLYHLSKIDPALTDSFAKEMMKPHSAGRFGPLNKLRQALGVKRPSSREGSSVRIHDVVRAALTINTWNLIRAGKRGTASDFIFVVEDSVRYPFPKAK